MCEKVDYKFSENEYNLIKMTNSTVRLGFLCAIGVGIIALCSKINVNVSVAGGDLSKSEEIMKERKRIINGLREKSYSDEQIADLLSLSLDNVKSISE